jgi:hypothetical protein
VTQLRHTGGGCRLERSSTGWCGAAGSRRHCTRSAASNSRRACSRRCSGWPPLSSPHRRRLPREAVAAAAAVVGVHLLPPRATWRTHSRRRATCMGCRSGAWLRGLQQVAGSIHGRARGVWGGFNANGVGLKSAVCRFTHGVGSLAVCRFGQSQRSQRPQSLGAFTTSGKACMKI